MNTFKKYIFTLAAIFTISVTGVFAAAADKNEVQNLSGLEKKVRRELLSASWEPVFDHLSFQVSGNTVTLYGQVLNPSTRKRAERFVKEIEGVSQVINNIEVLPLSGFDNSIRHQAVYALANQGGLYRYLQGNNPSLRIVVNRGRVTLEGIVNDETDKRLAFFAVNGIPGVFSVTNNLRTEKGGRN